MNRKEFGQLVKALRQDHLDENLRIWGRDELSEETRKAGYHLTPEAIGKIERGERQGLSPEELLVLADALRLTSVERMKFFNASTGIENARLRRRDNSLGQSLDDILRDYSGTLLPLFISDAYNDVVVANTPLIAFLNISQKTIEDAFKHPIGFNILRVVFDESTGFKHIVGEEAWEETVIHNIRYFRGSSLLYRTTPYFKHLITNLRRIGGFRYRWEEIYWDREDFNGGSFKYAYKHALYGDVAYMATQSEYFTSQGELFTYTYVPTDLKTLELFKDIAQSSGTDFHRLAPWPKD